VTPARATSLVVRGGLSAVALSRLARAARPAARLRADAHNDLPGITVVVPARDEAARITPCVRAALGAPGVVDVFVVDDQSTDATADVARDLGACVVAGAPLPAGWAGKAWALQQGFDAARTEWVVCLDADTVCHPALPTAAVAWARRHDADLVTVGGRFVCDSPGERWLHPSMLTSLVVRLGPPTGVQRGRPSRAMANGQCMVLRRDVAVGATGAPAWSEVRGHLIEDVAYARALAAAGRTVAFVDGSALLDVRMYDGVGATWRGWGRSLALAEVTPRASLALDVVTFAVACALPPLRLGWSLLGRRRPDPLDVAMTLVRLGTLAGTARSYSRRGAPYWASWTADPAVAVRLLLSAVRPDRRWRGRTYPTDGLR
jgi:dolichol-phosphate mannosyltransferase